MIRCLDPALVFWAVVVALILVAGSFVAGVKFAEGDEP